MEKYNYYDAMENDIMTYIEDNYTPQELMKKLVNRDMWEEELNEVLWVEDSITGNASGSYTFARWQAKKYVVDNMDILKYAIEDYYIDRDTIVDKFINEDWEYFDVTIRCYILNGAIDSVLNKYEEHFAKEN